VEDVGNAKCECKNYAEHSSPGMCSALLAGGLICAGIVMQQ
jgi:hypothetical protein